MSRIIEFFKILSAPSREGEQNQEQLILDSAIAENITDDVRDELIKTVREINKKYGKNAKIDIEEVKHMESNRRLRAHVDNTKVQNKSIRERQPKQSEGKELGE